MVQAAPSRTRRFIRVPSLAKPILIALLILLLTPPAASAAISDCEVDSLCVWRNTNFDGRPIAYPPVLQCGNLGGQPHVAGHNSSTFRLYVFRSHDCQGEVDLLEPGQSIKTTIRSFRVA
ncbi:MAG: peptidase inhibitor family I36 protein [Pseudonocardia sp.]